MQKGARKPRKPVSYGTLREFAAKLDVPLTTLSGWTKHDTWTWSKRAPWSGEIVPDVQRWAADVLEKSRKKSDDSPAAPGSTKDLRDEKLRQEIRKLRANADQAETALAKERGELHDADACEVEATQRSILIRNGMQNVSTQTVSLALSHGMPHESAPTFQKQVEDLINGCLRHLSNAANSEPETGDDSGSTSPGPA